MILNLILVAVIWINLLDFSGFIEEVEKMLGKWLNIKAHIGKPWSCSYCMTHHSWLLYLIISHQWTIANYALLLMVCFLIPEISDICVLVKQAIQRILGTFFDLTKR